MTFEYNDFEKFAKNFDNMCKSEELMVKQFLMTEAEDCVDNIKRDTPVDTGLLQSEWGIDNYVQSGETHSVDIFNPLEYASYMEDGYRTTKKGQGKRFVPGRWVGGKFIYDPNAKGEGMMLKEREIAGHHMCRINLNKAQFRIQSKFNTAINKFLKKHGVS